MSPSRAIEYRITRQILRASPPPEQRVAQLAERLIAIGAAAAGLLLFGSWVPELVAASVAGSILWALGGR